MDIIKYCVMKRIQTIILFAALILNIPVSAQSNCSFKKGYHGFVEFGTAAVNGQIQEGFVKSSTERYSEGQMQPGEMIRLSTVHGYSWGNGVFLGAGLGYNFELLESAQYASIFADAKYNFKDILASPFMEGRMGYNFCTNAYRYDTQGLFVSVSGGVDFGHFAARLGYEYCPIKQNYRTDYEGLHRYYYLMNQFFLSLAYNF